MEFLRSNTAVIVAVGPFFDKGDGVTIETALTITNERITLIAETDAGSAPTLILDNITGATSSTANDLNYIASGDNGMMQLELAAADVNRVGRMKLSITDAANHVPVFHDYFVLPQAIFDWLTGVIVPLPANATQFAGQTITAAAGVTLPSSVASPTNITAGTITTATNVTTVNGLAANVITAASIATDAITAAKIAADAIGASELAADAVTEIQSGLATPTNITAGTITTVTNLTNAPTAGDLTATMKASVNTEVVDALNVDTYAEIGQETPAATQTIRKMIAYLYKSFRNRKTQTATTLSLYADDATTVDQKATISDDGTTYSHGEIATGP